MSAIPEPHGHMADWQRPSDNRRETYYKHTCLIIQILVPIYSHFNFIQIFQMGNFYTLTMSPSKQIGTL